MTRFLGIHGPLWLVVATVLRGPGLIATVSEPTGAAVGKPNAAQSNDIESSETKSDDGATVSNDLEKSGENSEKKTTSNGGGHSFNPYSIIGPIVGAAVSVFVFSKFKSWTDSRHQINDRYRSIKAENPNIDINRDRVKTIYNQQKAAGKPTDSDSIMKKYFDLSSQEPTTVSSDSNPRDSKIDLLKRRTHEFYNALTAQPKKSPEFNPRALAWSGFTTRSKKILSDVAKTVTSPFSKISLRSGGKNLGLSSSAQTNPPVFFPRHVAADLERFYDQTSPLTLSLETLEERFASLVGLVPGTQ